jgi:hypothetical protein
MAAMAVPVAEAVSGAAAAPVRNAAMKTAA